MLKKTATPIISSNNAKEVAFVVACIRENKSGNRIKPIAETSIKNDPKKNNEMVIIVFIFFVLNRLKQQRCR